MHYSQKQFSPARKIRNVLLTVWLVLILSTSAVAAAGENATVFVTRLTGTYVGIKIVFPDGISGSFGGVINGDHFDCATISPDTLYCIGPFASWVKTAVLHIYEKPGGDVIFSRLISAPPRIGATELIPPVTKNQCPPGECPQ